MQKHSTAGRDYANLDLLRSIAVFCVFSSHLDDAFTHGKSELAWHFGQLGVLMFFVHTSLVLMQSMERLRLEGRRLFSTFYLRRIFRIYPLSIFCVTCAYAFRIAPNINQLARAWSAKEVFANLTLTQNLFYSDSMVGGLWTLPLEVQMYIALPFLFILFRNRPLIGLFGFWILSIPIGYFEPTISGRLNIFEYIPCFLAGVIAWRIYHLSRPKLPGWLWPFALPVICLIWMAASRQYNVFYRWTFCLALGCAIPWFHQIQWKPLTVAAKYVARYSYGIYLCHAAVILFCFRGHGWQSGPGIWTAFVVLMVVIPMLMYHGLEHPMINLGRRLTESLPKQTP